MFIRNPSEDAIIQELADKRAGNQDFWIKDTDVFKTRVDPTGKVYFRIGETELDPDGSALSQLLSRNEVPGSFFNKCPASLKGTILQTFCDNKTYLIRGAIKDTCRAVLSKSYTPMDDHQLFPTVLDELADQEVFNHKVLKYDNHITVLTTAINQNNTELDYYACITISNSETGHSSVWIEPSIIFKSTGLQISNRSALRNRISRFIHRGEITVNDIKGAINLAKEVAQIGLIQLMEEKDSVIDFAGARSFINSMDFFPNRLAMIVEEEIKRVEEINKIELIKKICEQAKELPLIQQIAVEQASGKFLGLFDKFDSMKNRISAITAEINE